MMKLVLYVAVIAFFILLVASFGWLASRGNDNQTPATVIYQVVAPGPGSTVIGENVTVVVVVQDMLMGTPAPGIVNAQVARAATVAVGGQTVQAQVARTQMANAMMFPQNQATATFQMQMASTNVAMATGQAAATGQSAQLTVVKAQSIQSVTEQVRAAQTSLVTAQAMAIQAATAQRAVGTVTALGLPSNQAQATVQALQTQSMALVLQATQALTPFSSQAYGYQPATPGPYPPYPSNPTYPSYPVPNLGYPGQPGGGVPGAVPPGACPGGCIYVVQTRDTMYSISRRFGLTVEQLAAANGIPNSSYIRVGDCLKVPCVGPMPGPVPVPPSGPCTGWVYVVQPGDTLFSIAQRFGVPADAIAAANGIYDPRQIYVGQNLTIPGCPPNTGGGQGPYPTVWPSPSPGGVWTPIPPVPTYYPPVTGTPAPPSGNSVYTSQDGKFMIQYPNNWQVRTDLPSGYVMFTANQTSNPFSTGYTVISKASSSWQPASQVLTNYQAALPGLMSPIMGSVTFTWFGSPAPVPVGGIMGMQQEGSILQTGVTVDRTLAQAVSKDDGSREYLVMGWSPPSTWDSQRSLLTMLMGTFSMLP